MVGGIPEGVVRWGLVILFVLFMWLLALVLFGLGCVGPRRLYWAVKANWYRDPAANEPSEGAYKVQRVAAFVSAGVLVFLSFKLLELAAMAD